MRIFVFCTISFLFLWSCKPSGNSSEGNPQVDTKALEDQLMAIHDEVMPRLTDIQHLTGELRKIKSTVRESQEGKMIFPEGLEQNLESLKLAEQGMWDWMKGYHDSRDSIPAEQLKPFLDKQMELIKSVQTGINTSIDNAQKWLAQNGIKDEK
jgi:hypothetical protein